MNALVRWFLDLLYPPKCMLCHRLMESSEQHLCGRCEGDLPYFEGPLRKVQYFEKAVAPFYYEGYIRDSILRFKFHGMQSYAQQYAAWMKVWITDELEGKYDMISWTPCGPKRKRSRGFDQSELLARTLSEVLGVPCIQTLKKIRDTKKQSNMPNAAARRGNVLGVYRAVEPERFRGKKILLVDDVLTTGATMSECGKTLRIAGSGELVCAAVAVVRSNMK